MPLIRAVEAGDLDALYEVCLRTGDAGADGTSLFKDPRLLGEVYVGPYLSVRGGLGLTAVDDDGPAGYALAAVDTRRFEAECEAEWWPALRARYPDPGPGPATPDEEVIAVIHRPHRALDAVVARFPAHLHLDLLPRLQGRGVGRIMMGRMLGELVARGVEGVHLGADARNQRAIGFYTHLGFITLEADEYGVVMGIRLDKEPWQQVTPP
ncbi:MAG: GNAT family N-acetyltransferase [Acidimicrobiia bacterium]